MLHASEGSRGSLLISVVMSDQMGNKGAFIRFEADMKPKFTKYSAVVSDTRVLAPLWPCVRLLLLLHASYLCPPLARLRSLLDAM